MLGWLKKIKQKPLQPETQWTVIVGEDSIRITDNQDSVRELAKQELKGVAIETNDSGPWGADLWWMLFDLGGQLAGAFPGGATGESALIDYVATLPSFNHGEMIRAMASTDNAVFVLWERSG